jgi:hypothetical protein
MKTTIKMLAMVMTMLLWSCGEEEEDVNPDEQNDGKIAVSLSEVSEGNAIIRTSGNSEAEISGPVRLTTLGQGSADGQEFYQYEYAIEVDAGAVYITINWPQSEGELMPSGDYAVNFGNLDDYPTERFIQLSAFIDAISYSTWLGTTGSGTITNTNADAEFDLEFEAQGLEEFFDEVSIDMAGAVKYRAQ